MQLEWLLLWIIVKVFLWEMISWKRSHFWMWRAGEVDVNDLAGHELAVAKGNPGQKPRDTVWRNLWCTNFGWTKASTLKPKAHTGPYRLGIINEETRDIQVCSLILRGEIGVLVGPKDGEFFALAYDRSHPHEKKFIALEVTGNGLSKYDIEVPII